jgi:hypothetical protein
MEDTKLDTQLDGSLWTGPDLWAPVESERGFHATGILHPATNGSMGPTSGMRGTTLVGAAVAFGRRAAPAGSALQSVFL